MVFSERKNFLPNSCFFSTTPRPTLGPTQPPTHKIPPAVRRRVKQSTNATGHVSVRNAVALGGFNPDAPWFIFSLCLVEPVGFLSSVYFMVITIKILPVTMAASS